MLLLSARSYDIQYPSKLISSVALAHIRKADLLSKATFDGGSKVWIHYEGCFLLTLCVLYANWDAQPCSLEHCDCPDHKTQLTVPEIIAPMIQLCCYVLALSADRLTNKANLLQRAPRRLFSPFNSAVWTCVRMSAGIHYVSLSLCQCDCRCRFISHSCS